MVFAHDFGATGDGQTDDTAALQHALQAGDGVLRLEKGTYRITSPLVLDLAQQGYGAVLGAGGAARIIMAGAGPALKIVGDHQGTAVPRSVKPQTYERERFPTISGVEILGVHPEAVGIELVKTLQCTVSEVLIRNCRYGLHLRERNRNFILSHSHIYDNAEFGIFFDNCDLHQTNLQGNHISYNKRAGIYSRDGDVHNLQITGNDIEYNNQPNADQVAFDPARNGAEIWFDCPTGVMSEVTIASNTIQATIQPGGTNIRIEAGADRQQRGACLIAITGNVLGSQSRGIELREAMRITITGNTLYDATDLNLLAHKCRGILLGQNTFGWQTTPETPKRNGVRFEDCADCLVQGIIAPSLQGATAAVALIRCTDCAVSDCQIFDPNTCGIELEDCTNCRIANNTIRDRREPLQMQAAIRVTGNSRQNLIQSNLLRGAKPAIEAPDEASVILQGNVELP